MAEELGVGAVIEASYRGHGDYFPGIVKAVRPDGTFDIAYDDDDEDLALRADAVRPRQAKDPNLVEVGSAVECRFRTSTTFYPGTVTAAEDGAFVVAYDDGDQEAGVERRRIRFPGQKQRGRLDEGETVDAVHAASGKVRRGTVTAALGAADRPSAYEVAFDNGDKATLDRGKIFSDFVWPPFPGAAAASAAVATENQAAAAAPGTAATPTSTQTTEPPEAASTPANPIAVGTSVSARYQGQGNWFPGKVASVNGDGTYGIAYDDGDADPSLTPDHLRVLSTAVPPSIDANKVAGDDTSGTIIGKKMECRYKVQPAFYPGTVASVDGAGLYTVAYDDGDGEAGVHRRRLRFPGERQHKRLDVGEAVDARSPASKKVIPATICGAHPEADEYDVAFDHGETCRIARKYIFGPFFAPDEVTPQSTPTPSETASIAPSLSTETLSRAPSMPRIDEQDHRADDDGDASPHKKKTTPPIFKNGSKTPNPPKLANRSLGGPDEVIHKAPEEDMEKKKKKKKKKEKQAPAAEAGPASSSSSSSSSSSDGELAVGTACECRYSTKPAFYPGRVEGVLDGGATVAVLYDDGERETVPRRRVRLAGQRQRATLSVGDAVDARADSGKVLPGTVAAATTRTVTLDGARVDETVYTVRFDDTTVAEDLERKYIFAQFFHSPAPEQGPPKQQQQQQQHREQQNPHHHEAPREKEAESSPPPPLATTDEGTAPRLVPVGAAVVAKFKGKGQWYGGVVTRHGADGRTYDITYDDGDTDPGLPAEFVKAVPPRDEGVEDPTKAVEEEEEEPARTEEAASPTPPTTASSFAVGNVVQAKYRRKGRWFTGKISAAKMDGTYDVVYDDGDTDLGLEPEFIELIAAPPPSAEDDLVIIKSASSPPAKKEPSPTKASPTPERAAAMSWRATSEESDLIILPRSPKRRMTPAPEEAPAPEMPPTAKNDGPSLEEGLKMLRSLVKASREAAGGGPRPPPREEAADDDDAVLLLKGSSPLTTTRRKKATRETAAVPDDDDEGPGVVDDEVNVQSSNEHDSAEVVRPRGAKGAGGAGGLAYSPCGRVILAAHRSKVGLWLARSGREVGDLSGHSGRVLALKTGRVAVEGRTGLRAVCASGGSDGFACLWLLPDDRALDEAEDDDDEFDEKLEVKWQAFARRQATQKRGPDLGAARNWNRVRPLAKHAHPRGAWVLGVALGRPNLLATSASDGKVRLWPVASSSSSSSSTTKNALRVLEGHTWYATDVAFHPEAPVLASSSMDKTVKLWYYGEETTGTLPTAEEDEEEDDDDDLEAGTFASSQYTTEDPLSKTSPPPSRGLGRGAGSSSLLLPPPPLSNKKKRLDAARKKKLVAGEGPACRSAVAACETPVHSLAWSHDGSTLIAGCDFGAPVVMRYDGADLTVVVAGKNNSASSSSSKSGGGRAQGGGGGGGAPPGVGGGGGHSLAVVGVATSADTAFVASCSHDGTTCVWSVDPACGGGGLKLLHSISCVRTGGRFVGVAVDDGALGLSHSGVRRRRPRIATLSADGAVRTWHAPRAAILAVEARTALIARFEPPDATKPELRAALKAALLNNTRAPPPKDGAALDAADLTRGLRLLIRAAMRELPRAQNKKKKHNHHHPTASKRSKSDRKADAKVSVECAAQLAATLGTQQHGSLDAVVAELVDEAHIPVAAATVVSKLDGADPRTLVARALEKQARQTAPLAPQPKRWRLTVVDKKSHIDVAAALAAALADNDSALVCGGESPFRDLVSWSVDDAARDGHTYLCLAQLRPGSVDYAAVCAAVQRAEGIAHVERSATAPRPPRRRPDDEMNKGKKKTANAAPVVVMVSPRAELGDLATKKTMPTMGKGASGRKAAPVSTVEWYITPGRPDVEASALQRLIDGAKIDADATLVVVDDGRDYQTLRITHAASASPPLDWVFETLLDVFEEQGGDVVAALSKTKPEKKKKMMMMMTNEPRENPPPAVLLTPSEEEELYTVEWFVIPAVDGIEASELQTLIEAADLDLDAKIEAHDEGGGYLTVRITHRAEERALLGWLYEALTDILEQFPDLIAAIREEKPRSLGRTKEARSGGARRIVDWYAVVVVPPPAGEEAVSAATVQRLLDDSVPAATVIVEDVSPSCKKLRVLLDGAAPEVVEAQIRAAIKARPDLITDLLRNGPPDETHRALALTTTTTTTSSAAKEEASGPAEMIDWCLIPAGRATPDVRREIQAVLDAADLDVEATLTVLDDLKNGDDEDDDSEAGSFFTLRIEHATGACVPLAWLYETILDVFEARVDLVAEIIIPAVGPTTAGAEEEEEEEEEEEAAAREQVGLVDWRLTRGGPTVRASEIQRVIDESGLDFDGELTVMDAVDGDDLALTITYPLAVRPPLEWLEEALVEVFSSRPDLVSALHSSPRVPSHDTGREAPERVAAAPHGPHGGGEEALVARAQRWRLILEDETADGDAQLEAIERAIEAAHFDADVLIKVRRASDQLQAAGVVLQMTPTTAAATPWDWLYESLLDNFEAHPDLRIRAIDRAPVAPSGTAAPVAQQIRDMWRSDDLFPKGTRNRRSSVDFAVNVADNNSAL